MIPHIPFRLGSIAALLLLPVLALAQPADPEVDPDGAADARIHLGPVALDPRLAIRNVGVDTNVFNNLDRPVRDFTATIGPETDSWVRLGRLAWSGTTSVGWTYFRESASQRSFDAGQSGRLELALGHLVPYAFGALERSRQRPNVEIDARVRRTTSRLGGGVSLLLGAKTSLSAEYGERVFDFGDAGIGGVSFARTLDRRETATSLKGRYVLTPLTTFVLEATVQEDRFRESPNRDSDSQLVLPGLEFRPLALVSGRASVGVRRFDPRSADLPGFSGLVSDVELSYLMRDLTRFSVGVRRNIDYSFEDVQPYYVSTGTSLSVVQALGSAWDVVGRLAHTALDYQSRTGEPAGASERRDRVTVYGAGFGRRFGTDVRIGVDLDHARRTSTVEGRAYEGLRGGGSFTYGF